MIQFILDLATTTVTTYSVTSVTTTATTIKSQTTMHGKCYSLFLEYFDKNISYDKCTDTCFDVCGARK